MSRIFDRRIFQQTVFQMLFDIALVFVATVFGVLLQTDSFGHAMPMAGTHAASLAAGLFVINTASGFYERGSGRTYAQTCARAAFALALALPLTYMVFALLPSEFANRNLVLGSALVSVSAVIVRRVYVSHVSDASRARSRVLIYGAGTTALDVANTLREADPNIVIVGYVPGPNEREPAVPASELLPVSGTLCDLARRHHVDEIVVALTERRAGSMPMRELLDCKLSGVKTYDISTHFEKTLGQIRIDYLNAGWLIFGDGFNPSPYRAAVKRAFDVFCALLLLIATGPVMALFAVLIKLESRGPLLYRQQRVGQDGALFDVVKFRSMRADAEKDGQPRWATTNDDRVTRIGRFMRRSRIDELPQLFNVLSGEMSLVGPRPERPFFVEQLTKEIPYFAVRHSVKPGVTGWAQVRFPYGATVEDSQSKLQFDLYYVKNHSLYLDAVILLETVRVVLTGTGAR
jgi:sugar transferase (PEP-CTERM system associated)